MQRTGALILVLTGALLLLGGKTEALGQDGPERLQNVGLLNVEAVTDEVMQTARSAVMGPDEAGKDGPLAVVGMELAVLYHQHRAAGANGVQALRAPTAARPKTSGDDRLSAKSRTYSPLSADGEFVTVDAIAAEDPGRLLRELRGLGLEGGATAGNVVSGRLPISSIKQAAALSSLRGMMPSYARTSVGSAESEADSAHWTTDARTNRGVDGSGQKVCVLSDSYNQSNSASTSASEDVQSGDLPGAGNPEGRTTPVDILRDDYDGTDPEPKDEGRAMLQLVHDIAPGARLGFHTAFGGLGIFAQGIRDLADGGCTVIVDDVRYNSEPFYQDGPVTNTVDDVVNSKRVTFFSSAGNEGENSYEAPFRSSSESSVINSGWIPHDFDASPGTDTRQAITIRSGGTFQIFSFQWTDPSAQVQGSSGPDTDIDIALVDQNDNIVVESTRSNDVVPVESMEYTNDGDSEATLDLVVEKAPADPEPDSIKYVYTISNDVGGESDAVVEEYDTGGATLYGHSMAEGAMAVAAAPYFNTARYNSGIDSSAILEYFSSKGGLQIHFDQNGDELPAYETREKPDVTGTDFVDNTFFGTDIDIQDPDSFPNFAGTSAAAPNVAAVAALIQQARQDLSPTAVYDRLQSTAVDIRFRQQLDNGSISNDLDPIGDGVDPWSGHGFVRADRAVPSPTGVQITDASVGASSTGSRTLEVTWRKAGTEEVDEFLLEHRFFDGAFVEEARIDAGSTTEFARIIEDLPVGRHTFRISAIRNDSTLATTTTSGVLRTEEVDVFAYPNPFRDQVNLSVTFPKARNGRRNVRVDVFDLLGRRVATPILSQEIGDSESIDLGGRLPESLGSGVYFFRVWNENMTATTRAVRVR